MKNPLVAAYSPHGAPGVWALGPFRKLFDRGVNAEFSSELVYKDFDNEVYPVHSLILWGGTDIHPSIYGQEKHHHSQAYDIPSERDLVEWEWMRQAYSGGIPMIGVCRGAQYLCAFAGGKLFQHVSNHSCSHEIETNDGKKFKPQAGHHQMMDLRGLKEGEDYELIAWNSGYKSHIYFHKEQVDVPPDMKEPEIVYFKKIKALAIQPHPEWGNEDGDFAKYCNTLVMEKLLAV